MLEPKKLGNLHAILGPTNTGKTFLAFERLLSYQSGIFGFPLRLLARENYDKAIKKISPDKVALITGEEKIIPSNPKYFFCTVESMPIDLNVECVAIDEVQLCSDYERGHIFTDKILNLRGSFETILLGSLTIKNILKKLFPNINIEVRDRFSKLSYTKKHNISKIKPRSAVIAFNVNSVYEIAESLRSLKGGAAVVLGSLSPRTRNAQVEIYENKNVDFLVATDAIGMGLNLNIDHIIFSSLNKHDGRFNRHLHPAEIGQIAGRAGRFQNDGTFGLTKDAKNLDPLIIQSIEEHNFDSINKIYWRNSKINFSNVSSVIQSLSLNSNQEFCINKKNAEDEISFRKLCVDTDIKDLINSPEKIKLLWDVCHIPDFQKIMNDSYIELLKNIFLTLMENDFFLPENWINVHVSKLEDYRGGIDELSKKIANIRTWTFISNQSNWLKNKNYWQEKTRKIEDYLSDQLHEKLTNRFIDISASYFFNRKNINTSKDIEIKQDKSIILDDKIYGYIYGFDLELDQNIKSLSDFTHNHVKRKIRTMIKEKINDFIKAPSDSINFGDINNIDIKNEIKLYWGDDPIGILKKGKNIYSPIAQIINTEFIESDQKTSLNNKLQEWIDNKIKIILSPIKDQEQQKINSSEIRSITFNLFNNLGTMPINDYLKDIKKLDTEKKSLISKLGIRIGVKYFFIPNFLKKNAIELNAILWQVFNNNNLSGKFPLPKDGRVSFSSDQKMPDSYWQSIGYICINNFAVRVDVFERVFFLARKKIKFGPFIESPELMNPIGCGSNDLSEILNYCGISSVEIGNEKRLFFYNERNFFKESNKKKSKTKNLKNKKISIIKHKKTNPKIKEKKIDPNSPFAVLQKLL